MGMDISGGMIVGCKGSEIFYEEEEFDCVQTFADYHEMDIMNEYYDSHDSDDIVVGYCIRDVSLEQEPFDRWLEELRDLTCKFEDITGVMPKLIGMQNVW